LGRDFLLNTLFKERLNGWKEEEEDVSSYWNISRKREYAGF
jgi:hypothetical protein